MKEPKKRVRVRAVDRARRPVAGARRAARLDRPAMWVRRLFRPGGSARRGSSPEHCRSGFQKRRLPSMAAKPAVRSLCQIRQKRLILLRIAEPGIGPVAGRGRQHQCACGDPAADPYSRCRSGQRVGPGAAIWNKRYWVPGGDSRQSRSHVGQDALSGHPFWNFERPSHVAVNLQSLPVRAGKVIFCSPNEQ
jgi:hypothetical protein